MALDDAGLVHRRGYELSLCTAEAIGRCLFERTCPKIVRPAVVWECCIDGAEGLFI